MTKGFPGVMMKGWNGKYVSIAGLIEEGLCIDTRAKK